MFDVPPERLVGQEDKKREQDQERDHRRAHLLTSNRFRIAGPCEEHGNVVRHLLFGRRNAVVERDVGVFERPGHGEEAARRLVRSSGLEVVGDSSGGENTLLQKGTNAAGWATPGDRRNATLTANYRF